MKRQNHEDGIIVGRHSLLRYDVQIPGRAWPWDGVGTLGPQHFEPGEAVKIGFLKGNPQLPFIVTQKPWPQYSGGSVKEPFFPPPKPYWATWRQSLLRESRPSDAEFTSIGAAGVMVVDSYAGNFLTRCYDALVYVVRSPSWYAANNAYRNTLSVYSEVKASSPPLRTYNPGGNIGIVEVLVTDDTVYLVEWQQGEKILSASRRGYGWWGANSTGWSRIRALNRANFAVRWTTAWRQDVLMRPGPSLAVFGERLVCLCEVSDSERPKLATLTVDLATGGNPVKTVLAYDNPPYTHVAGLDASYYSNATTLGGPVVDPWGGGPLYNSGPNPSLGWWPTDNATNGTIWWQDSATNAMPAAALFNTWLAWPDLNLHIPCPRYGQQVAAYNAAGDRQWIRRGWADVAGKQRTYTPIIGRADGRLVVLVEEFNLISWSSTGVTSYDYEEYHEDGTFDPLTSYSIAQITGTVTRQHSIAQHKRLYWEVWDAKTGETVNTKDISELLPGSFPARTGGVSLTNRPANTPTPPNPLTAAGGGNTASWTGQLHVLIGALSGSTSHLTFGCSVFQASTYRPLRFDIFNCCVSTDGAAIVFGPRWNLGFRIGEATLWPRPNTPLGNFVPTGMGTDYDPRVRVFVAAYDWEGNKLWENAIETDNPSKFTVGNCVAVGPNIIQHYRRNDVGYVRVINAKTGVTVSERVEAGLKNSPAVSGDVYGELTQHYSGLFQGVPTLVESVYVGRYALLTKLGNNLVFFETT